MDSTIPLYLKVLDLLDGFNKTSRENKCWIFFFFLTAGCGGPEYCTTLWSMLWLVRNVATNKDFQI